MPKFTQKYTLITILEHIDEESEHTSSSWPLHVTIADTFAVDIAGTDLLKKI